jgi:hypothetical protein
VAANALVTESKNFSPRSLIMGSPGARDSSYAITRWIRRRSTRCRSATARNGWLN